MYICSLLPYALPFSALPVRITQSDVSVDEDDPTGFVMVCAEVVSGSLAPGQTASATLATSTGSAICKCNKLKLLGLGWLIIGTRGVLC